MRRRWSPACSILALAACVTPTAPSPDKPSDPGARPLEGAARSPQKCPASIDLPALLARHAAEYGSTAAVEAALPLTRTLEIEQGSSKGKCVELVDKARRKSQCTRGPLELAEGIDEEGSWALMHTGALVRLADDESAGVRFLAWLEQRRYLDEKPGDVSCKDNGGRPIAVAQFPRSAIGDPALAFDLESGALLRSTFTEPDGSWAATTFEEWSPKDKSGVRWPVKMTTRYAVQEPLTERLAESKSGVDCGQGSPEACFQPPAPKLKMTFPKTGRASVKFEDAYNEIMIHTKLGKEDVIALLDSGAGITAIDGTGAAAKSFKPAFELSGSGATQKVHLGFGEIEELQIGDLKIEHLPAASVPIPAFADFGKQRPAVVLGFSLFQAAAIRIDYARKEVIFANEVTLLKSPASKDLAIKDLGGKVVARVELNKADAPIEVDTGNAGAFALYDKWAAGHNLPGSLKAVEQKGRFGAGEAETVRRLFRLPAAKLGPIEAKDMLVSIASPPAPGNSAGLVGNTILGRCRAVIFDLVHRKLWFEGPCDRPVRESRAGWRLTRQDDESAKDRPWVITGLVPGGSAARAGVEEGDRLLQLGGSPATIDVAKLLTMCERPVGTKLSVEVLRGKEVKKLEMILADLAKP
jgi:PDZ domain-containing protein/aspartyl protease